MQAEVPHHVDQLLHVVVVHGDLDVGGNGEGGRDCDRPVRGGDRVRPCQNDLLGGGAGGAGGRVDVVGADLSDEVVQDHGVRCYLSLGGLGVVGCHGSGKQHQGPAETDVVILVGSLGPSNEVDLRSHSLCWSG